MKKNVNKYLNIGWLDHLHVPIRPLVDYPLALPVVTRFCHSADKKKMMKNSKLLFFANR